MRRTGSIDVDTSQLAGSTCSLDALLIESVEIPLERAVEISRAATSHRRAGSVRAAKQHAGHGRDALLSQPFDLHLVHRRVDRLMKQQPGVPCLSRGSLGSIFRPHLPRHLLRPRGQDRSAKLRVIPTRGRKDRHQRISMTPDQNPQAVAPTTRMVIDRFNEAFNRQDADDLATVLTDDTVFEDTSPAPDGRRIEGKDAVVAFWRGWFARNPDAVFEAEDVIVSDDRAVVRWVYRKRRQDQPWHLRGVDVFTVRDGKVAAKLAYVKG